ncbi:MAG: hypothetical protein IRZ13_19385, partial [Acetobacteraceae bacterium]|nr:hypothetical protein [Acetobacteraceae bacterium]
GAGRLVAVPALDYPDAAAVAGFWLDFAPAGGPLAAWAAAVPASCRGRSMGEGPSEAAPR